MAEVLSKITAILVAGSSILYLVDLILIRKQTEKYIKALKDAEVLPVNDKII